MHWRYIEKITKRALHDNIPNIKVYTVDNDDTKLYITMQGSHIYHLGAKGTCYEGGVF